MKRPFLVRPGDVQPYHPANHSGTTNLRLIGADHRALLIAWIFFVS